MKFNRLMDQLAGVFAILVLAIGTLFVLAPFFTALVWGAILAYCTWKPFTRLASMLGGRRTLAAELIVLFIFVVLLGPIFYSGFAFFTHVPHIVELLQQRLAHGLPPLPAWVLDLPLVGPRLEKLWVEVAARNPETVARAQELAGPLLRGVLHVALAIVGGLGLLALSVLFALFFYIGGENAAKSLAAVMHHIAGGRGAYLLGLMGATVRGVVYGILGTSFLQAILCAIGYWIAGLPSPAMLGLVCFFLAILPAGTLLITVPAAIWLVQQGSSSMAIFVVVWSVVVGFVVDNVIKPMMIGRSSNVPFILIMLGVLGGAAAFGFLGIFIGPTLLAVAHAVLQEWTAESALKAGEELEEEAFSPRGGRPLP